MKKVVVLVLAFWLALGDASAVAPPEPVLQAALKGDLPTVQAWVEKNRADVNTYGWDTRTLLHLASAPGHLPLVDYLLKNGADPNQPGDPFQSSGSKQTPLHVSAWYGQLAVTERLLLAKANVNATDGGDQRPLHYALLTEKQDLILRLLTAGADIHASDRFGNTPYLQALKAGKTNLANLMLIHSANPKAVDRDANSLLHLATLRGDVATMEELIRRGANLNARNGLELTPLHLAIEHQMAGAVKALLDAKAQVDFLYAAAALGRAQDLERSFTSYPSLSPDTTDVSGRSFFALGGFGRTG